MKVYRHIKLLSAIICGVILFGTNSIYSEAAIKKMVDGNSFDAEFYANTYQDVKKAIGTDETLLYNHYITYGKKEGRLPYANYVADTIDNVQNTFIDNFDAIYYANKNPDVVKALGNDPQVLYNHYITYGKKEGRLPNASNNTNDTKTTATTNATTNTIKSESTAESNVSATVYIAASGNGKVYHSRATCGRMKSSKAISLNEARRRGLSACKNCH